MRCFTSALICCSARSSWVMASTVERMDSTPRRIGGRTRSCPAWMTTSSIFQEAKPGAVILTRYFPGGTARKEKAPATSDCVMRVVLVSLSSMEMCAVEMVAWSVSVTVPERTEALGASGNWVVGICWARRPTAQEPRKRRRAQRLLALGAGLCFDLVHPMAAAACPATPIARMVAGECRLSKENVCVLRLHAGAAESAPDVMGATRADRATTRAR